MLGSHSTSTGFTGWGSPLRELVPKAVTMPQYFAKHGYRTESLGKIFHIGHGNEGDPESFSVPHFKEKVIEYADPASTPGGELTREEAMFQNKKVADFNQLPRGAAFESPDVADDAYADGRVAEETLVRLAAAKEREEPFFIAAGFARPHLPFSAPKKYWDLYDPATLSMPTNPDLPEGAPRVAGKRGGEIRNYSPVPDKGAPEEISDDLARQLIHGYYASTSYVDAQIGKVLAGLDELGLAENTIVVLWGDHGFHLGDLGIWTKHTNYEQATRIPLVFAGPGIASGATTRQLAESVDVYPTVAELAGLPAPHGPQPIDGLSLVKVLEDAEARVRNHAFHAYPKKTVGRAIRTERYRLVEWKKPGAPAKSAEIELYDYEIDPLEGQNLAAEKPEVVFQLRKTLDTYPEAVSKDLSAPVAAVAAPVVEIAGKEIALTAEVNIRKKDGVAQGVVLSQGGNQHGYAIHFVDGKPAFDVRVSGRVVRLMGVKPLTGNQRIEATLGTEQMALKVYGGESLVTKSPGLIPAQPKDPFSIGDDPQSAAGDYQGPNPFNQTIVGTRVDVDGKIAPVPDRPSSEERSAGIAAHDRAIQVTNGWIRDPYIVTGPEGRYYLTGTTPNPSDEREQTDPYNTGLGETSIVGWKARVWRSDNLSDWTPIGKPKEPFTLLDGGRPTIDPKAFSQVDRSQWRLWAPELHWIDHLGKWALVHTSPGPVAGANLSLSHGNKIEGHWTNPIGLDLGRRHDPSLFKDDDGTWYLIWGATKIQALKPDFTGFAGEVISISPAASADENGEMGHEGCLIQKIEGKYVLFGTGWSTGKMRRGTYNLYYATADKIEGPYSERKFVGRFLGHGTPFQDTKGRWWCSAFFNANLPPIDREGIQTVDLGKTAQTINQRGVTLVPLEVGMFEGDLRIRAIDPAYATPGPDEAQDFAE